MPTKSDNAEVEVEAVDEPTPTGPSMGRRGLMKGIGATAAAGVAVGHPAGPVQESEAIAPVVAGGVAAAGIGAGIGFGWTLRDQEVEDDIDAVQEARVEEVAANVFNMFGDRRRQNQSTFIQNAQILDGVEHVAWAESKIEAIREIADGKSEDEALDAFHSELDEYESTIKRNFIRGWNSTVQMLDTQAQALGDDEDEGIEGLEGLDVFGVFRGIHFSDETEHEYVFEDFLNGDVEDPESTDPGDSLTVDISHDDERNEYELPNGEIVQVSSYYWGGASTSHVTPVELDTTSGSSDVFDTLIYVANLDIYDSTSRSDLSYNFVNDNARPILSFSEWNAVWTDIDDTFQSIRDGGNDFVPAAYDQVQSGDLDPTDLLSERELAELTTDDEEFPQALMDLRALGVSVNAEREAQIHLTDIDAEVFGTIGYTGDGTLETGMVDPETDDEDYFLTYDISRGEGTWSAYDDDSGVDGGVVTFTQQPFEETSYYFDTGAGETVTATADDFQAWDAEEQEGTTDNFADVWIVDLSDQGLEDTVTTLEQVEYYSEVEESKFETVELAQEFEIVTFRDGDGEEYAEADYSRSEPHDDDNYLTQSEWEDRRDEQEKIVEEVEEALDDARDGGGAGGFLEALEESNSLIGLVILAILAAFGFGAING